MSDKPKEGIDAFHAHLDVCWQCQAHPFDLCRVGDRLIREAAQNLPEADPQFMAGFRQTKKAAP